MNGLCNDKPASAGRGFAPPTRKTRRKAEVRWLNACGKNCCTRLHSPTGLHIRGIRYSYDSPISSCPAARTKIAAEPACPCPKIHQREISTPLAPNTTPTPKEEQKRCGVYMKMFNTAPPSCPHTAQDDIRWLLTSRTLYMQNVPFPFPGSRDFSQKHSMTRPPPSERSKQWTGCPESRDPLDKSSEVASRLNAELARRH